MTITASVTSSQITATATGDSVAASITSLPTTSEITSPATQTADVATTTTPVAVTDPAAIDAVVSAQGVQGVQGIQGDAGQTLSPNVTKIVGKYYDQASGAGSISSYTIVNNTIAIFPYFVPVSWSIDQAGIFISSLSTKAKIVIYSAGDDSWPSELLLETAEFNTNATSYRSVATSFTFAANTQYWIGIQSSGAGACYSIPIVSAPNLGLIGSTLSGYYSVLRKSLTFTSSAPSTWSFSESDLVSAFPPSIRMRAA